LCVVIAAGPFPAHDAIGDDAGSRKDAVFHAGFGTVKPSEY